LQGRDIRNIADTVSPLNAAIKLVSRKNIPFYKAATSKNKDKYFKQDILSLIDAAEKF